MAEEPYFEENPSGGYTQVAPPSNGGIQPYQGGISNDMLAYVMGQGSGREQESRGMQLLMQQQERQAAQYGAQSRLYGIPGDMAQHVSVRVNPRRSGLGASNLGMDSWARARGLQNDTQSYGKAANHFWGMESDRLAATQQALVRGGFLKGKDVAVLGRHDPAGRDHAAWTGALEMAARRGVEVFSMLDELAQTGHWDDELDAMGGGGGASGPKPPRRPDVQLMSGADAEKLADEIGQSLIGRKLSDNEKRRVVRALHSTQRSEQSSAIDVAMTEAGGGTQVNPTTPQTVIENEIRGDLKTEVQGAEALGAFDKLLGMIGGGN